MVVVGGVEGRHAQLPPHVGDVVPQGLLTEDHVVGDVARRAPTADQRHRLVKVVVALTKDSRDRE